MIKTNYSAIIPYKIKDIISLIIDNDNKSFFEAIKYLHYSDLYEYLSNEETKYWHFSYHKLYSLLLNKK